MIIRSTCPQCSANLDVDDSRDVFFCQYCGYKMINAREKVDVVHTGTVIYQQDRSNEPNLFITYNSSDPTVSMTSIIPATGYKNVYTNGTTQSFKLAPGTYVIKFKIGTIMKVNRKEERTIKIVDGNTPVKISVGLTTGLVTKTFININ